MLRKTVFIIGFLFLIILDGYSLRQIKLGYVDIEEVFNSYPGIEDIRKKLLEERKKYQIEIDKKKDEITILEKDLQNNEKITDEERQRREAEIEYKKELLNELINESNAKLNSFKEEVTKPIYQKIVSVIQKVSAERGFSFVFKKGSEFLLFYDKEFDLTGEVKQRLRKELSLEDRN